MTTNSFFERISQLSPKRLALLAMELQTKLEAAERQKNEPIAVIGMACRFPGGANSPEAFWELLQNGVDAITEIPPSRWPIEAYYDPNPDAPGKISTRWGGFMEGVDRFEPQFFGISPREAVTMDPQQRLTLEVGWEALERAGYAPDKLVGSKTGVFMGICNSDYFQLLTAAGGDQLDTYAATGSAHSVVSGRLSYVLGLQGPSLSVDTACSSSLVAIHLAVQSLRQNECRMALAGGVNVLASIEVTIALSKGRMMASDGRCKAFDAAADGFVRSEGCGLVVLKRLSHALADGDNILAVIRGSAINQDGRSNGLTAPNGPSQEAVILEALANGGVEPNEVSYVETHGTGTSLGDPIEAQALGAVLKGDKPLAIGSVKTNIGHLEAAAGVAGLIKLVLSLQHGEIPPNLHLNQLSPYIPWDELSLVVPTERTPWVVENGRRIGGVSSFGFSGTNVHLIVEEAPAPKAVALEQDRPLHLVTLSAKSNSGLQTLVAQLESHLATQPAESLADIAFTSTVGRAHFNHRLAIAAAEPAQLQEKLAAWSRGEQPEGVFAGQVTGPRRPEVVFLFTGQGPQYVEMGRRLYETQPTFRRIIDQCDELLRSQLDRSLLSLLYPEAGQTSPLDETTYTQPALFAIEYALAELWRSWGIEPAAVMGHSLGEYVAACVAGLFSLEDALKLVSARGRLMQEVSTGQQGEMAAVFAGEAQVAPLIAPYADRVSIAAINGLDSSVISGETVAVQAVLEELKKAGIRGRRLAISIAGHSPLMDPILDAFEQVAAQVTYKTLQIELISGVTGRPVSGREVANAAYWRRHLKEPVRFLTAITTLHEQGYNLFLEVGPTPTLVEMGQRCLPEASATWLPSLRPKNDDWEQMLNSLAGLYTQGVNVDWTGFERDYSRGRQRVILPTYPFEKERYWVKAAPAAAQGSPRLLLEANDHPLLGRKLRSPAMQDVVFETQLSATWPTFLDHHRVYGMVILPSPAYIEMALAAAQQTFGPERHALTNFTIHEAFILPEEEFRTAQLVLKPTENGQTAFQVFSLEEGDHWKLHVTGALEPLPAETSAASLDIEAIQVRCQDQISGELYYQRVRELGLEFGSDFRGITQVWRRDGEALGLIQLPESLLPEAARYQIHPAFLDACFHLLGAPLTGELEVAYLLIGIEHFRLYRTPGPQLWNHTVLQQSDLDHQETFTGQIRLFDESGQLVAEVEGLHLKRAGREAMMQSTRRRAGDWLYQVQWEAKAQPALHLQPDYLPAPSQLAAQTPPVALPSALQEYRGMVAGLDALCAAYIVQALQALGCAFRPGEQLSSTALGVVSQHQRLLKRLLEILTEEGILQAEGSGWRVVRQPTLIDPESLKSTLSAQYPAYQAELTLASRCGMNLAGVLRGQQDPLHLLFPGGSLDTTEQLYQNSPVAGLYNTFIQQLIATALERLPQNRSLRVLEIGAGTGATTSYVLPALPADRTAYFFTDMSPLFTSRAAEKFKDYPFVQYQLLDIELQPESQGFDNQQFDLVIAANVLHATADLRRTLSHVQQLLAPQGLLLLLEGTKPQRWVDLTFGLTEGWWKFSDHELRPTYPLLTQSQWLNFLQEVGFAGAASTPAPLAGQPAPEQIILLAQAAEAKPATTPAQQESWLILADKAGMAEELAARLERRGDRCFLVFPGETYTAVADGWQVNPACSEDFRQLMAEWGKSVQGPRRGVINLWSLDNNTDITTASLDAGQLLSCGSALHLVQALAQQEGDKLPALWLATRGAQSVGSKGQSLAVAQAALWGLGRVIALEHPEFWGGLIDLDPQGTPADNIDYLLGEILASDGEDQVAWREGQRHVARLARKSNPKPQPISWEGEGAYLITGGLGGLGLKIAHWMVEQGARYLVLMGRRGLPERSSWATLSPDSAAYQQVTAIQAIEALGATVVIESADVSNMERMATLLAQFGQTAPPLRGIVHAAAALSNWKLKEMPVTALQEMLKSKVMGTWVLHQLTQNMNLDFFSLFSSTTALWGSRELGHYAAANSFLDSFAHYRRALELPALSINWGTWDEMRVASAQEQQTVAQFGLNRMPAEQALGYMGDFLGSSEAQVVVASVDWNLLKPAYEAKRQRPFLHYMGAQPVEVSRNGSKPEQTSNEHSELLRQLAAAQPDKHQEILVAHLQREVSKVLGIEPAYSIDVHQGLFELGLDSLMSVELKGRLEVLVKQSLPSTLIFNYPTIADLSQYLGTLLNQASAVTVPAEAPPAQEDITPPAEDAFSIEMDDLSEDELATLLIRKLEGLQ
jgi:acyl transferase domain-containing protein/acyl carrier protein